MPDIATAGNKQERELFHDVLGHYTTATTDLDHRIIDFDKKDELFRSYIDERKWPYRAQVFDPRVFTTLYEKTARLLANKPRGRMNPREGGDALGAKINNELLSFQWDDNERVDTTPMLAKWALMDLNARKYGASFGLVPWHWERQVDRKGGKPFLFYDGPDFKPWANRDVLHNPSYSTIKNWIQLRSYATLQELQDVNYTARSKPIYKNLDLLHIQMKQESTGGGDRRNINYISKNKSIKGLEDYLGTDQVYKTIEIVTEYRPDRWITFSRRYGVILQDIPNPYDHGQIPVVQLKYYPIDDDIYGLSEIEPVEKMMRALNAYINQNLDTLNMATYPVLKVNQTGGAVQMHTLQFGPGAKWMMNNPLSDVLSFEMKPAGLAEFPTIYRFMVGAIAEGFGEASAAASGLDPTGEKKTATEIKDTSFSRSARDNFNRMFLEEAIKKQMTFWFKMNQQFLFSDPQEQQKVIRVTGKDAIRYFQQAGLDADGLTDESIDTLSDPDLAGTVLPTDLEQPLYPIESGGETINKLMMEDDGQSGSLIVEPEDLSGNYDYIPDVGSMSDTAGQEGIEAKREFMQLISGVGPDGQPSGLAGMMVQEGKRIKATDLIIDYAEDIGFKNADQYIENLQPVNLMGGGMNGIDPQTGQPIQGGVGAAQAGTAGGIAPRVAGMATGGSPFSPGQSQSIIS